MREDQLFAVAFGAFFALSTPPVRAEPLLGARHETNAKDMYMNTILEYRRAAESGNRSAQEMLGLMYLYGSQLYGEGVARDMIEAERWLECAAVQGSVLAKQLLRRYVQGESNRGRDRPPLGFVTDASIRDTQTRDLSLAGMTIT